MEDNPTNLRLVESLVTKLGFEFHSAQDGEEGIEKARTVQPDLILMDISLPGIDGIEATRRIKKEAGTQHIPIIAVTARISSLDEQRAREAGCIDYITKPINLNNFISTLERIAELNLIRPRPSIPEEFKKVLLVDDNPENKLILSKFFKENGIEVFEADNGAEALDFLLKERVDFIISDVLMPEMDGFEFCYTIRKKEQLAHVPLIFYSAYFNSSSDGVFADNIGGSGYFQRPIKLMDFYSNIARILRNNKTPEASISEDEFRAEHLRRFRTKLLLTAPLVGTFTEKQGVSSLAPGFSYLLEEETPRRIYEIYRRHVTAGSSGLAFTRENPETVKKKIGSASAHTRHIWLSDTEIETYVSTKDLTSISVIAWDFIQKHNKGVIILDGFEYLCSQNGFQRCLSLIQVLKERVSTKDSIFLLSINPQAFEPIEYTQIKKELVELEPLIE